MRDSVDASARRDGSAERERAYGEIKTSSGLET